MTEGPAVITTKTSDRYHRDERCPLFRAGQNSAISQGFTVGDPRELPLAEAAEFLRPCTHCIQ